MPFAAAQKLQRFVNLGEVGRTRNRGVGYLNLDIVFQQNRRKLAKIYFHNHDDDNNHNEDGNNVDDIRTDQHHDSTNSNSSNSNDHNRSNSNCNLHYNGIRIAIINSNSINTETNPTHIINSNTHHNTISSREVPSRTRFPPWV